MLSIQARILLPFVALLFIPHVEIVSAQDKAGDAAAYAIPATDDGLPGAGPIRRAGWFQNVWKNRRTTFASRRESDRGAVVFLGDSITQGWRDDFRGAFSEMKTANVGISGDTTRGMLIRLKQDVLDLQPAAVVMLMGTNDLEERAEPATIAGNVELIIKGIRELHSETPIVLCKVFPSSASKTRPADKIQDLNRRYEQIAKADNHTTVLDTWTLFADKQGDAKKEEFPDLLHPNEAGYKKWTAAIRPVFATLGFLETETEPVELEPGFQSLFNGKDLSGWGFRPTSEKMRRGRERWQSRDKNAPPWPIVEKAVAFDGKTKSDDGRYATIGGRLVVTTPREGRKIQQLWTTDDFDGNFQLRLEFRATPNADSGVFIREPQLQCRDFALAGPYKELKNYRPQDWNELEVTVKEGVAHCTCNGEVIEDALKVPPSGPIGLEGDRGQVEYRRIRLKKLP